MDKLKLELDVVLPENGDCERCVERLQTSLQQHRGVEEAHVDRTGRSPRLCLHFDPDLVSLAEIEFQDKWQRARIAVAAVNSSQAVVEAQLMRVLREAESTVGGTIVEHGIEYF